MYFSKCGLQVQHLVLICPHYSSKTALRHHQRSQNPPSLTPIIKVSPLVCVCVFLSIDLAAISLSPRCVRNPQQQRECTGEHTEVRLDCGFHQRPPSDFPSGGTQVLCPTRGLVNCLWKLASLKAFFWSRLFFFFKKRKKQNKKLARGLRKRQKSDGLIANISDIKTRSITWHITT